ncbi:protoporphyrinogen/coproporphyrinogen oxidase [Demequina zhanjiangensis]|uniref:FAD-dependent oxidoreductase n=1 Tax=Demequina zhanjiangensis TaxID=3051659 RepID=A0ABT8G4K7_9MICO|nr:FAD-dependent oxidoreductase [Demequina sp. SYSU T00b26]MDN4474076.1 FAD-dependent oxidoreductase [Demequina sp. SYSU T00b26]
MAEPEGRTEPSLPQRRTVAVVGGGIAGLLAARRHLRAGDVVTVLEAAPRVGGRVSRLELDGLELDAGAESFAVRDGAVERLVRELGLEDRMVAPAPTPAWVVGPTRAHPLPAAGWMGVPVDPFAPDVVSALGRLGSWRVWLDTLLPVSKPAASATAGSVIRRRIGRRATTRLVEPVVRGIYSRPLDELPFASLGKGVAEDLAAEGGLVALAAARRQASPAGSAAMGLEGGIATIAEELARQVRELGGAIRTGADVVSVRPDERDGWLVEIASDKRPVRVGALVVAVPQSEAYRLLPGPERREEPRKPGRAVLVTLVLNAPALDSAPRGTGVLAVGGVTRAKALTHATAKWRWLAERAPGRHVVRLSYDARAISGLDREGPVTSAGSLAGQALADASRLLGVTLTPAQVRAHGVVAWPDSAPSEHAPGWDAPHLEVVGSAAGLSGIAAIVSQDFVLSNSQERMTA